MWLESRYSVNRLSVRDIDVTKQVSEQIDQYVGSLVNQNPLFVRSGKKCAYVTLASPTYDFGLKVLLSSLRRHSSIPVIVLVTRRWEFRTNAENLFFLEVPTLFNDKYQSHRVELGQTLTKLWVFGLTSLDRIVFLDADCLVRQSVDDLFDRSGFCCAPDYIEDAATARFNSGVMAFEPSKEIRDLIYEKAYSTDSYDHGDQGLLNNLLAPIVKFLPVEYNLTRHYSFYCGPDTRPSSARIIHYIVKKPWELWYREMPDVALLELDALWTAQLSHADLLELVSMWRRRQFIAERPRFESLRGNGSAQTTWASIFGQSRKFRLFVVAAASVLLSILLCAAIAAIVTLARL
jgi:glycogenin